MDKATKKSVVAELQQVLGAVSSVVLTEYRGLDVDTMTEMRSKLREAGVRYRVVKNTLMKRAIQDTPMSGLAEFLVGPVGMAYAGEDDPSAPAKACLAFAKGHDKFRVKAGYADGQVLTPEGVTTLSTLLSKDEVRAQLLSLFIGTPQKLLALFSAAPRDFLGVLNARKEDLLGGEAA